ncbi:MAG: hypothetical protein R3B90_12380 [Planctomycetaceae bacterium]
MLGVSNVVFTGLEPVTITSLAGTVIVDIDAAGIAGPRIVDT